MTTKWILSSLWYALLWILFWLMLPFTVLSFFELDDYRFDIISHFRVQYLVGWAAFLLLTALSKRKYLSGLVVLCLLLNLSQVTFYPDTQAPIEGKRSYKLMSYNLYMGNQRDYKALVESIKAIDPDILFLIETAHHWQKVVLPLKKVYPYHLIRYGWVENGVALYSKYPLREIHSPATRAVAGVSLPDGNAILVGCHPEAPRTQHNFEGRNDYYMRISEFSQEQRLPLLVFGDMNSAPWAPSFKRMLSESGLNLISDSIIRLPTWPADNPLLWVPIDHFLYKGGIRVIEQTRLDSMGSDHFPIMLEFQLDKKKEPDN